MKTSHFCFSVILSLFTLTLQAVAGGSSVRGGGDLCEDRIKIIRDDLKDWINKGGPNGLTLPSDLTVSKYSDAMLSEIGQAKIRCVSQGDNGFPVTVNGTPKVCRYDKSMGEQAVSWITCDAKKFEAI